MEREFSDDEREAFGSLAASTSFVGVCLMLFGVLMAASAVGAIASGFAWAGAAVLGVALVCVPAAWWTVSAGRSLTALVATRGKDVENVMAAVADLRRLFGFARIVVVVFALAAAVGAGLAFWC